MSNTNRRFHFISGLPRSGFGSNHRHINDPNTCDDALIGQKNPMRRNINIRMALAFLLALPALGWAQTECAITLRGELPLQQVNNRYTVAAQIDHKRAMMLVDSGARHASLDPAAGDAMMLYPQPDKIVNITGADGTVSRHHPYIASSLTVGPVTLLGYDLYPGTMASPNETRNPAAPIGLIGSDILSRYDVEMDFPNKIMRFYEVSNCSGRFVPWEGEYQDVHAMKSLQRMFIIPVGVNGHVVRALVDTGAGKTFLNQDAFKKGRLSEAQNTGKAVKLYGVNNTTVGKQYKLDTLQIGRSLFQDVSVYVEPGSGQEFDMLLGMDFMKWRKVWLSYKTEQVFMQYPEKKH